MPVVEMPREALSTGKGLIAILQTHPLPSVHLIFVVHPIVTRMIQSPVAGTI